MSRRSHARDVNKCLLVVRKLGVQEQVQQWCGVERTWTAAAEKRGGVAVGKEKKKES